MASYARRTKDLFVAALEQVAGEARQAFLDRECADDPELRQRLDVLLQAHDAPASVLNRPFAEINPQTLGPMRETALPSEVSGAVVGGRYKLVEEIGTGGMGTVWMARQQDPVKRLVAVKVIKPGMDSKAVLARFAAERQALAMMDHANIAKMLDAGATENGRPYFVMELVKGVPISAYCDEHQLTLRQRLELFIAVCQAVQHAHQKGIIHRDLKPSNILVTLHDTTPVVKVIDFGVAKALGPELTDKTLFTGFAQMVGTPLYMSPEQAGQSGLDIDTRSDIYSLGVLLYELLTGTTPFGKERFKDAPYEEIRRIVREEEPPKPSTRLSQSKDTLVSLSAQRQTEPAKLTRLVRGELDWIVMKALEKDRQRRYPSASALAADVTRYLNDETVEACPPSAAYRLRKLARRHRAALAAACLLLLALIVGMTGAAWGMFRAEQQRQHAEINERKALAAAGAEKEARETIQAREAAAKQLLIFVETKILAAARPQGQEGGLGRDVTLREALEAALPFVAKSFPDEPIIEARLRTVLGSSLMYLGDAKTATEQFEKARALYIKHLGADDPDTLRSTGNLAVGYGAVGKDKEALKLIEEALPLMSAKLGPQDPEVLQAMSNLATNYTACGRDAEANELRRKTLELRKATLGPDHPDTHTSMFNLAVSYSALGKHLEARALHEQTLPLMKTSHGPVHPNTLKCMRSLANSYDKTGRRQDALDLHLATLGLQKKHLGATHPDTLGSMNDLALTYSNLHKHDDALKLRQDTLSLMKDSLGPEHPKTLRAMNNLASSYGYLRRYDEALDLFRETLNLRKRKLPADHRDTLQSMWGVSASLVELDRGAEAVPIIDDCVKRASGKFVDPELIPCVMALRLRHFRKAKDAGGCRTTAEMWDNLNRADADSLYTAACMHAIAVAVGKQDPNLPRADADRLAEEEADKAMDRLVQAVAAGRQDALRMKNDPALAALRERQDFRKLLADLEKTGKQSSGSQPDSSNP